MDDIRTYLLGIVAAAIICGIVTRLIGEKGTQGAMAKLMAGLFLAFTVIRPVANISLDSITDFTDSYADVGRQQAMEGERLTKEALAASIKTQTEAYILDKAAALRLELEVQVTVAGEDIPAPTAVRISGKASPYGKLRLQSIISEDLGIDKECQTWT